MMVMPCCPAQPTAYDDKIYSADWRAFTDPEMPATIAPTEILLDRHLGTPVEHKAAVIVDGEPVSYGALARRVAEVSAGLCGIGVVPENRVLLFGTDSLDYVIMWLGAIRVGAVPAVVSDLYKAPELLYFIRDTAARFLFIDAEQMGKLAEIAAALPPSLETVIVRGDAGLAPKLAGRKVVSFGTIADSAAPAVAAHPRHPNDVTYMFFSGGTTGTAKGITHLAHDFLLVPERQGRFWEYRESDVVFATSKKYFTHGLWPGLLIPLYWGATAVLIRRPPLPELVLETMAKAERDEARQRAHGAQEHDRARAHVRRKAAVSRARIRRQRVGENPAGNLCALPPAVRRRAVRFHRQLRDHL